MINTNRVFAAAVLGFAGEAFAALDDGKCRGLVLSGGSNYGSWEVGVVWGLTHYGNPEDYYWDVVSGISAGAINTAATTPFAPEEVVEMTEFMSDSWASLTNDMIWHQNPGTTEELLFDSPSFLDDEPAVDFMTSILSPFTEGIKKRFTIGAVDVGTGQFVTFNQTNTEFSEVPRAAMSSGSIPIAFAPQHFKGHILMDGGTVWNVNIDSAIKQCTDAGFAPEDIILDVLVCEVLKLDSADQVSSSAISNFSRSRDIQKFYRDTDSIFSQLNAYPEV